MFKQYKRITLLCIIGLMAGFLTVTAATVDLPDTNRVTLSMNPNAVVRVYETDDPNYYQYRNGRYAFNIMFPVKFTIALQSGNNDGARFSTTDKQEILAVAGSHNSFPKTLVEDIHKEIQHIGANYITYQAHGDDWYVLSWVKNGKIYYRKRFISPEYYNSFTLSYPQERREYFDDIVVKIEQSFVPGWKTGRRIWG